MSIEATLGKKIKAARRSKKISQCELAQTLHISEGHLSHLETGKNVPSIELLLKLCNLLDLTPNDLLLEQYSLNDHSSFSSLYQRFSKLTPDERTLVDMGITPHTPTQNRTCAINAYGFSLYIFILYL